MQKNEFKLSFKQQLEALTKDVQNLLEHILLTDEYFIEQTKIGKGSFPIDQKQTKTILLCILRGIIDKRLNNEGLQEILNKVKATNSSKKNVIHVDFTKKGTIH